MPLRILVVFGTRPEAIKLAPVISALAAHQNVRLSVCNSGQHQELLNNILQWFDIEADHSLDVISHGQSLTNTYVKILQGVTRVIEQEKPDIVVVQGDTLTTLAAAQAAYLSQIKVAHVEAGLRTYDAQSPWPEEGNRRMMASITNFHFAPTERARHHLLQEFIPPESIFLTGNTVVDALRQVLTKLDADSQVRQQVQDRYPFLASARRLVLVTAHRRENFATGLDELKAALLRLAEHFADSIQIVLPVHKNPVVSDSLRQGLSDIENVHLIEPQDYVGFVFLMSRAALIITDSGGVQEEAPSLGVPTIVTRQGTERSEGLEGYGVYLIPPIASDIYDTAVRLLDQPAPAREVSNEVVNPYGDGLAGQRIADILSQSIPK